MESVVGDPRITLPRKAVVAAPTGVTLTALEALLMPAGFVIVAVHEYSMPFDRPATRTEEVLAVLDLVAPPSLQVTV